MKSRRSRGKMATGDPGGFTIIEVVLVLAIAGLIFLMVFIALPSLQRSQRDTQRRNDMANVSSKITQYQTNNNGKLPSSGSTPAVADGKEVKLEDAWPCNSSSSSTGNDDASSRAANCFIRNYLNGVNTVENEFVDPDGWAYGLTIRDITEFPNSELELTREDLVGDASGSGGHMVYIVKKAKCEGEKAVKSNNARDYAVMYKLEGAGTYCHDNS